MAMCQSRSFLKRCCTYLPPPPPAPPRQRTNGKNGRVCPLLTTDPVGSPVVATPEESRITKRHHKHGAPTHITSPTANPKGCNRNFASAECAVLIFFGLGSGGTKMWHSLQHVLTKCTCVAPTASNSPASFLTPACC